MRTCPKCGEQYADDDLRTMCGSCMTSLPPAGQVAPAAGTAAPPPARPAVAVMPRPAHEPAPPSPAPAPEQRAAKVRITQVGAGANARASAWAALGWAAAAVSIALTIPALAAPASNLGLVALLAWAGAVWCARQWSCYGWVRSATVAFPGRVRLGEKTRAQVSVIASKPLHVDRLVLSLESREQALAGESSRTRPRVATTHREVTAAADFRLEPNQAASFDLALTIPADAPASFTSPRASVDWVLRLWVAIPGWHADVREGLRFRVAPYLAERPAQPPGPPQPLPIMDLADGRCEILIGREAGGGRHALGVLRTGAPTPVRFTLQPLRDLGAAIVMARLDYTIRSKGPGDTATVFRAKVFDGDLTAAAPAAAEFTIPALPGPLSYAGRVFSIDWSLTIEVHQGKAPVRRASLAVAMLPGWEAPEEAAHAVLAGE